MKLALLMSLASIMPQPMADQTCMATTVYLESRGQPDLGQAAVAEVILRRQDTGRWGDTVCDVVNAPKQFAPTITPPDFQIDDGEAWRKAWAITQKAMDNWKLPPDQREMIVPQANHFATLAVSNDWTAVGAIHTIGDHAFYAVN